MPSSILEWGVGVVVGSGTFFTYDAHNRLIAEERVGPGAYDLDYTYDAGGNRKQKRDFVAQRLTEYHYDVDANVNPPVASNRMSCARSSSPRAMQSPRRAMNVSRPQSVNHG